MIHPYQVFDMDMLQLEKYVEDIHHAKDRFSEAKMQEFLTIAAMSEEDFSLLTRYISERRLINPEPPSKQRVVDYYVYHGIKKNHIAKATGIHFATVKKYEEMYWQTPLPEVPFSEERENLIAALYPIKDAINKHNFNFMYKL